MVRDTVGEAMFSAKPVIQSAFHAARQSGGGSQSGLAGDYIERKEFRTLLIMLRQYYELYAMFNRLDTSDDRRIDKDEFKQGAEMVKSWGVTLPDDTDGEFNSYRHHHTSHHLLSHTSHLLLCTQVSSTLSTLTAAARSSSTR